MTNFWQILYLMASAFLFFAYLIVLFHVLVDMFRDRTLSGGYKALWLVGLIFLPLITALIYIITRGAGMAERQHAALARAQADTEAYIRNVAGKSPAEQIADAKVLLDAGTITPQEFEQLKSKALA